MSTGSAERPVAKPRGTAHRVRVIIFRVVATLAGLIFVVAVVLMASAPWVLLQPDQDIRTELNRWFLTVAGSVDAITAGVLLVLGAATASDIVGRRTGRGSRCGRRDHPSLPAQLRCHPRSRRDPADRLPVLARLQDVSILVGWCFPPPARPRCAGRCRAPRDSSCCPFPTDGRNPIRPLTQVGGRTTPSKRQYSHWLGCSPPVAGLVGAP